MLQEWRMYERSSVLYIHIQPAQGRGDVSNCSFSPPPDATPFTIRPGARSSQQAPISATQSMRRVTRPVATVRPPSRTLKRWPCSMASGWWISHIISTLSPGWTCLSSGDSTFSGQKRWHASSMGAPHTCQFSISTENQRRTTYRLCECTSGACSCCRSRCDDRLPPW